MGDCGRAVIACLLHVPVGSIPNWAHDISHDEKGAGEYWCRMLDWLGHRGWTLASVAYEGDQFTLEQILEHGSAPNRDLFWILCAKSRSGVGHVVVRQDRRIVRDPSLDESGIVGPHPNGYWHVEYLIPLHPHLHPDAKMDE